MASAVVARSNNSGEGGYFRPSGLKTPSAISISRSASLVKTQSKGDKSSTLKKKRKNKNKSSKSKSVKNRINVVQMIDFRSEKSNLHASGCGENSDHRVKSSSVQIQRNPSASATNMTRFPSIGNNSTPASATTPGQRLTTPPSRQGPELPEGSRPQASERRKKLPLLSAIKPENEKSEKERFMRANYQYNPYFIYRFPADEDTLEKSSKPSDKLLPQAILIMENAIEKYGSYENYEIQTGGQILNRGQIYNLVKRYLKREDMENEILLNLTEELLSRGSMTRCKGKPQVNIRVINLREYWVEGLLRHEVSTHYLRSSNNKHQPWYNWKVRKDLNMGPINPTEEGLASLHSVLLRKDPCLWRCALLYYTVFRASQLPLKELFKDLSKFVSDPNVRWDYCIRAKRGQTDTSQPGAFCKDQVYLNGALQILKNRRKIDFPMLIRLGKVAYQDVDRLRVYADLEGTRIPSFMADRDQYLNHLDRIAELNGLTDEVLEEV